MNWLDIVLLLILTWSVLASFRKGLTREIVGLVSVIAAILCGLWFYGNGSALFAPYVSSPQVANLLGFFAIFLAVLVFGSAIGFILGKFLKVTGLSIVDHALGAVFGLVRGTLIAVAVIMGVMAFSPGPAPPRSIVRSRVAPYAVDAAHVIASMAPHELKTGFQKTYEQVKTTWNEAVESRLRRTPNAR